MKSFSQSTNAQAKSRPTAVTANRAAQWRRLSFSLVLSDLLMLLLGSQFAYMLRFTLQIPVFKLEVVPKWSFYTITILALTTGLIVIFALLGLYQRQNILRGTREYSLVFNGTTIGLVVLMAAEFFQKDISFARGWVLMVWFISFFFVALGRFIIRRVVRRLRSKGYYLTPALIIGTNDEARLLAEQFLNWKHSGMDVVGLVANHPDFKQRPSGTLRTIGSMEHLDDLIQRYDVEELILAKSAVSPTEIMEIFERYGISRHVNLRMSSGLYEVITTGMEVSEVSGVPLTSINRVRLTGPHAVAKAVMDYSLAIPVTLAFLPIFAVLAILVRLDSPGPAIHRRRVMGVNGKQFDAFKFRTMYVNGDEMIKDRPDLLAELEANQKLKVDPRVTRVGALLRKFSLDELPQLFNVLINQMSLVGPRMISPPEMAKYGQLGMNLLTVKPGLTGLWQTSGRSDVSYKERVYLDMYYIRNWSIWLDIQILIRTIPTVLSRRGAY